MLWLTCKNCGKTTTELLSISSGSLEVNADFCYVGMVKEDWVKGCKFDECEPVLKELLDKKLISPAI